MADRLESDFEAQSQQFDVVACGLGLVVEPRVRQDQRPGEIVRQADPRNRRGLPGQAGFGNDSVELWPLGEKGELGGELEGALTRTELAGESDDLGLGIKGAFA